MEQTEEVKALKDELKRYIEHNCELRDELFCLKESNSLSYQLKRKLREFWGSVDLGQLLFLLIVIEAMRLGLEFRQVHVLDASHRELENIRLLIINFMDLVKPGARG